MYGEVTPAIIRRLIDIVGERDVITGSEDLAAYSHDETLGVHYAPDVAVRPRSTEAVQKILRLAQEERIPVTPRGGGTGVSGGALPLRGGVVLSLEKMDALLDLDPSTSMVVVQPGMINGVLQRRLEEEDLLYPVNPASLDSCTIGGNVAESSSGSNAVKYGGTRNYVCGLEAVLPGGELVRAGGKLRKNATDAQLVDFFLGSEGTLGVITEITLRTVPFPDSRMDLIVPLENRDLVTEVVRDVFARKVCPTTIEYVDEVTLAASRAYLGDDFALGDAPVYLLVGVDGREEEVSWMAETIGGVCLEKGASDVLVAQDRAERERLWKTRHAMRDALLAQSPLMFEGDMVVPRDRMICFLNEVEDACTAQSLTAGCFGHLGDGNVHVNVLRGQLSDDEWAARLDRLLQRLFNRAIALGGKISGEHGIGLSLAGYLSLGFPAPALRVLRGVKQVFDPQRILNPGKPFDETASAVVS